MLDGQLHKARNLPADQVAWLTLNDFYKGDKLCSSERGNSIIKKLTGNFSLVSEGKLQEILFQLGSIIELGTVEFQNNRGQLKGT